MKNKLTLVSFFLLTILLTTKIQAADVSGNALYQGDILRPIGFVMVTLKNIDNNSVMTYKTGADGYYLFTDVPAGNYVLTGTTGISSRKATYFDAALVFLHVIGFYEFTPIQFLASDVNANGKIEMADYSLIINNILRQKPFPAGPWRFETAAFNISGLKSGDNQPKGLGGTCSGDVGGAFVPTSYSTPALPIAQDGILNVNSDKTFTSSISTGNDLSITGAGLIINYPADLLHIESVEFKGNDYEYNIENGQIRLVWGNPASTPISFTKGESFITIHGTSTDAFTEGMTASLGLDASTSLVNSSNKEIASLNFSTPLIKFGKPSVKLSNYPNPFKSSTTLSIDVPEEGKATIEVYSATGQLVKKISAGELRAGNQEINLDASQLAKGNYVCKLRIQTKTSDLTDAIRLMKAD